MTNLAGSREINGIHPQRRTRKVRVDEAKQNCSNDISPQAHGRFRACVRQAFVCHLASFQLWPPYVIGQAIIFLPCGFFLLSIYLYGRPIIGGHYSFAL